MLIRIFSELVENHREYKNYFPVVNEEAIRKGIADLHMRVRTNDIVSLIMNRTILMLAEE